MLAEQVPQALKHSNAIPLTMAEVPRASRDYPVVFARSDQNNTFSIVAILGLRDGENLFVSKEGKWDKDVYQPAYLRRYPFCMATITQDGNVQDERIVCVEKAMLDQQHGLPLEKEDGQMLTWWSERLHLLQEYEADLIRTRQMCDVLEKLNLLRPFAAQAISAAGEIMNLAGMHQTDELNIAKLKADDLRMLIKKGIMSRLYAHMMSLDNLGRLLDRQKRIAD